MNVKLDAAGNATGGLGNDVVIKGNVAASVGAVNSIDKNGTMTRVNLALDTDKSSLQGAIVNGFDREDGTTGIDTEADEGGTVSKHFTGENNLWLQNGATWTNEQQSHVTTTTIASKNPVWAGSTLATLHGGKDAANAGLIYQKDNNPISVVNYSGHTTVFYDHDAADPTKIIGGSFNITNAAEGSAITFITDNKGITSGFAEGDSADAKDKVANVLNSLAGKLFYKNYTDGHLAGVVKIAEGLTASSAALKTGDISFSTEDTGTFTPG